MRKGEVSSGFIEVPVWVRDHDFLKVPPGQGCGCVLTSESYFYFLQAGRECLHNFCKCTEGEQFS